MLLIKKANLTLSHSPFSNSGLRNASKTWTNLQPLFNLKMVHYGYSSHYYCNVYMNTNVVKEISQKLSMFKTNLEIIEIDVHFARMVFCLLNSSFPLKRDLKPYNTPTSRFHSHIHNLEDT